VLLYIQLSWTRRAGTAPPGLLKQLPLMKPEEKNISSSERVFK